MGKHVIGEPGGPVLGRLAGLRVPLRFHAGAGFELAGWHLEAVAAITGAAGRYHVLSTSNGGKLARWLREDLPHLDGLELTACLLAWLDFVHDLSKPGESGEPWDPEVLLRALDEAAKMAVLELTKLEALPGEG